MADGSNNKTCEGCNGQITPNQILARQAGLVGGILLCPECIARKREELMRARSAQAHAGATHGEPSSRVGTSDSLHAASNDDDNGSQGTVYFPPEKKGKDEAEESLSLIDDGVEDRPHHQIRSFSEASTLAGVHRDANFKRAIAPPEQGATRCRTFHGKLTAAGLAHMDEQINEWIDGHPDIYIKTSSSTVGIFEGKTKEPHLLVTLFY